MKIPVDRPESLWASPPIRPVGTTVESEKIRLRKSAHFDGVTAAGRHAEAATIAFFMIEHDPASQPLRLVLEIHNCPRGTGLDGLAHLLDGGTFPFVEIRF
jgi:hypothetical protein